MMDEINTPSLTLRARILTLLFSSLIGSTFISACLVVVPQLVHHYWYKLQPDDHRKYIDVSRVLS